MLRLALRSLLSLGSWFFLLLVCVCVCVWLWHQSSHTPVTRGRGCDGTVFTNRAEHRLRSVAGQPLWASSSHALLSGLVYALRSY